MLNHITLNTLILILICARYSHQKPFGRDIISRNPPHVPKPFQFLSLFGVYKDKDDQEGLKQDERQASQSNKAFENFGSVKSMAGKNQRKEMPSKTNNSKLRFVGSRNQNVRGRKHFNRKPPILRIQPSFLIDKIKQIFFDSLQPFDTSEYKTMNSESIDKSINPNVNQPTYKDNLTHQSKNQGQEKDQQPFNFHETFRHYKVSTDKIVTTNPFDEFQSFDISEYTTTNIESIDKSINPNVGQPAHEDNESLKELKYSGNNNNRTHQSKNQAQEKNQQSFNFNDTFQHSKVSTDIVNSNTFDELQSFDIFGYMTTDIESIDKSINPNVIQPTHEDNKTLEELKFSGNNNNRTHKSKNLEPEKDQQFFNFNDTFRNSKVSTVKSVNSDPFDRIFFPLNNKTHFTTDKILQAPNVYSNKTDNDEALDSLDEDLIIKPDVDLSEEFQESERIESNSSSSVYLSESFIDQTNQPTFERYRMYQQPYKSENERKTSGQYDQLFGKTTNQPTTEFKIKAKNNESHSNKISSIEKLDDFILSMINQSIPEFEKVLREQEISENGSANNIFKKSVDSDINSQLLESESSESNFEFITKETTSNDQFVQILNENNQQHSNFSNIFRNPKVDTHMTLGNDKLNLSNVTQPAAKNVEVFNFHTETIENNEQYDSITLETSQPNVISNRTYQNPIVASSTTVSKFYTNQNSFHNILKSTFHEKSQDSEFGTYETTRPDQFSQLNLDANKPSYNSSKAFRNSEDTAETTVSYSNLHQFTISQTYQFFFDFDKVFQEPQASTILAADNDAFETSFIPNLIGTTFESDEEFQTSDISLNKTDTNNSLNESVIPETNQTTTEFLETYQEPEEPSMKTAETFSKFILTENYHITTGLDKNFSKMNASSDDLFENSVIPQSTQTKIEFTETFEELKFHPKESTTLSNSDLKTEQSVFASNEIFRNPHVPEVTDKSYIKTNETTETNQDFFQYDKLTAESMYSTADVISRETPDTLIPDSNQKTDIHVSLDSYPIDFTINHSAKTSNADFKEKKHLKNKTAFNDSYNQQFLYPLCSKDSDLRKLALCDNEYKSLMCNDASSGTIKKCDGTRSRNEIPLCFMDLPHGRFLVSCSTSPTKMCLYESEVDTAVRFCREPETAICIDERNKLEFCQTRRVKRQVPKEPKLDKDAYYAKCEKCKLQVLMDVVEDQKPVVKIRSEPYGPNDEE